MKTQDDPWVGMLSEDLLARDYGTIPIIEEEILDRGGLLTVIGATEVGKSYFLLQMALNLATGTAILGQWGVVKPVKVLFIQGELSKGRHQERVKKLIASFGSVPNLRTMSPDNLKLDNEKHVAKLSRLMVEYETEVVIFDPIRPFHTGDENSSQDMERVFTAFREYQNQLDVAVAYSHHERKPSNEPSYIKKGLGEARGTGLFIDRLDTAFRLTKNKADQVTLNVGKLRNVNGAKPEDIEMMIDYDTGLFVPTTIASTGLKTKALLDLIPAEPTDYGQVEKAITTALDVSRSSVRRKLIQMEDEGLVVKTQNPDDARKKQISSVH